ncbi:hypothetical protein Amet_4637 [Alkaliphilus metalliredigens QYMF]|uniref:Lipoprotein n=1 Tax=Alkaliphilus metalliredigens (strain QYMF) TaxID=293826 RepID=A6TWZ0_ALKMQ|nr:hypothetical protein [Alkaliphilus metalliredigens]ABR50708.1 hypothetical protein Amet_4637 [Alkaliphilus metalliredigens QYMF]
MMSQRFRTGILSMMCILILIGCGSLSQPQEKEEDQGELQRIKEFDEFSTVSGFDIQEGKFYFTGFREQEWGLYSLDLNTVQIRKEYEGIAAYDLFIPIEDHEMIYIDVEGRLFHQIDEVAYQIDEEIRGIQRPNLLMAPNEEALLYTKGGRDEAKLFSYSLVDRESILIKEGISEEAFQTFGFTTHWSHEKNDFIFDNEEIYELKGNQYARIKATTAKWAPDDHAIAFIEKPQELEGNQIRIGDWNTYIGEKFVLFYVNEKMEKVIYRRGEGLIDAIDSIQWSQDGSKVGISIGEIIKEESGELRTVEYSGVFVYDLDEDKNYIVEEIPYNFYEILFNRYIYTSPLGRREKLIIAEIEGDQRKIYDNPVLVNSMDMFIIVDKEVGYLVDGQSIIKIRDNGKDEEVFKLPWELYEMYLDPSTQTLIIFDGEMRGYLLDVGN